jgi:hypothetical protein
VGGGRAGAHRVEGRWQLSDALDHHLGPEPLQVTTVAHPAGDPDRRQPERPGGQDVGFGVTHHRRRGTDSDPPDQAGLLDVRVGLGVPGARALEELPDPEFGYLGLERRQRPPQAD